MKISKLIAVLVGLFFVGFGLWSFFAPLSFYDQIAAFGDYNRHFLHDVGAFQLRLAEA